jgi:hypothetical protein
MFARPGLRAFSLSAERASNAVSCGVNGVFVGDVPLLQAADGGAGAGAKRQWSVRPPSELNEELSAQYGLPIDVAAKANALALIAAAFNRGDLAMAAIATVQMQFPDPPLLTKGRETEDEIARRALELHRSRLLKFWDPAKHPRTGTPPNPGWFAPESGGTETSPITPAASRLWPWNWLPGKKPFAPGGPTPPPGTVGIPLLGGGAPRPPSPGGAPTVPKAPAAASPPAWAPPDPKSKLPFMSQTQPQLAPYVQGGKTSGIFRAPGVTIELQSGYDGPTTAIPTGTPGFDGNVRSHVEAQAAAIMRLYGISEASVEINNPKICDQCNNQLKTMVPPGATLWVVLPNGQRVPFKGE